MKKTITGILATILTLSMCASCGTKKNNGSEKVELAVGSWPATEGASLDRRVQQKADFELEYSNITIVPDTWTFDLKTFYPKAEAGLLPNLFAAPFTEISKLMDGEYVADLTEVLKENGYLDKLNDKILGVISKNGKIYALPTDPYSIGLVYNTDMFEAAGLVEEDGTAKQPKDWREMAEFAVKIKEATGKPGFVLTTTNNTGGWLFTNIAWSYGVDFMEQDKDGKWKATFNTPEMIEALQFVSDLKWKYDVLPSNILIDQKEQQKLYATGGAGMILASPGITNTLVKYETDPKMFGIMSVPAGPKRHVSLLGGVLNCVSSDSSKEQIDAAIKWFDFIGNGVRFDDVVKANIDKNFETYVSDNRALGAVTMSSWNDNSEKLAYTREMTKKHYNMKPNAAKHYSEGVDDPRIEIQPEEPICAQDLYGVLDNCIQQVLNHKDADIAAIVEKANTEFQINFLDNVDY